MNNKDELIKMRAKKQRTAEKKLNNYNKLNSILLSFIDLIPT